MRQEIIEMCVAALKARGHARATAETIFTDAALSREFLGLLRDCRPLKVIRQLIAEVERERSRRGYDT